jgi:hypothetical protein
MTAYARFMTDHFMVSTTLGNAEFWGIDAIADVESNAK